MNIMSVSLFFALPCWRPGAAAFAAAAACAATPPASNRSPTCTCRNRSCGWRIKRGGELRLARLEEPLTMNPLTERQRSIYLIEQVYETLVEPMSGQVWCLRREKWEISEDGLVYTFTLRDAKFSTGDPVTTATSLFSLNRLPNRRSARTLSSSLPLIRLKAVDTKPVKITLKEANAPFLSSLAVLAAKFTPRLCRSRS